MNRKFRASLLTVALLTLAVAVAIFVIPALAHDDGMDMDSGGSGGGDTGAMGQMGSHMKMSDHMTMTETRAVVPADTQRGEEIIRSMRAKLAKYEDYNVAIADGYVPYMAQVPQDVYHFASRSATAAEYMGDFDLARPGSLLYEKKTLGGYKLVGAMYDAPPGDSSAQLDQLIPLSLSHWHAHTNICLPRGVTEDDVINGRVGNNMRPDISSSGAMELGMRRNAGSGTGCGLDILPIRGSDSPETISNEADCQAAGGSFHKQIFGWMIHVYPFASEDLKVAFSTEAP